MNGTNANLNNYSFGAVVNGKLKFESRGFRVLRQELGGRRGSPDTAFPVRKCNPRIKDQSRRGGKSSSRDDG